MFVIENPDYIQTSSLIYKRKNVFTKSNFHSLIDAV